LTKSAPAEFRERAGHGLLLSSSSAVSRITLTMAPASCATFTTLPDIVLHGIVVARAQRADVDHHVDFLRAARSAAAVSATLASVLVAPSGNPTTVQTLTGDPASSAFTSGTQ
jgi:hypothetical protein